MAKKFFSFSTKKFFHSVVRDCYVSNPYPRYQPPKADSAKPAIVKALVKAAENSNPARHEAWYATPRFNVKTGLKKPFIKRMNAHRARAVNALMVAMADRLNIVSGKVEASVEQLSDWCSLSTGSGAKKSISRTSRALITLEELGAIRCERIWDNTTYSYIPKIIWVTDLFFVIIDYALGKFLAAQNQQLAWENQKLREKGEASITLSEARRRAKEKHIKKAFDYRLKKRAFNKQRRHAHKIDKMEPLQARHSIINDLMKLHKKEELEAMGHHGLRRLVNQRYYALRKLAASTVPPPNMP